MKTNEDINEQPDPQDSGEPDTSPGLAGKVVDFIDLTNRYIRQEVKATMEESIVGPLSRFGKWFALITLAAGLLVLGLAFFAIGIFQLLATLIGTTWIVYLIISGLFFIGAAAAVALAPRGSREAPSEDD